MDIIFRLLEIVVLTYFAYVAIYTLILSVAGLFYKKPKFKNKPERKKIVVFIPAYKEDGVIVQVAEKALNQTYGKENYDVVIIADSLQKSTLDKLRQLPVITEVVSFEKSTKVKALNEAMKRRGDQYDYGVILDADNIMEPHFLEIINDLHQQGYNAIQGHRAAKNQDNTLSFLDGLSEEINNHIYGKGSTALKLSSSLKGSGMSFNYGMLKQLLGEMESIGGFDRELELRLVNIGTKVYYAGNAIIYDEKVAQSTVFESQRTRWISSQYFYLKKYFAKGLLSIFQGKMTYFNSSLLRNIQLPRLLNLGLNTFFLILIYILSFHYPVLLYYWLIVYCINILGIFLGIPRKYYSYQLIVSVFMLPVIFWKMFLILFKLKDANKKFIHTPHSTPSDK